MCSLVGNELRIERVSSGNIYYYAEDMIGSSRVITTPGRPDELCYDADFYPFGGERTVTNNCPQNYKFQGKERDAETGNDDFGARYYIRLPLAAGSRRTGPQCLRPCRMRT